MIVVTFCAKRRFSRLMPGISTRLLSERRMLIRILMIKSKFALYYFTNVPPLRFYGFSEINFIFVSFATYVAGFDVGLVRFVTADSSASSAPSFFF